MDFRNSERSRKSQNCKQLFHSFQPSSQSKNFVDTSKKLLQNRNQKLYRISLFHMKTRVFLKYFVNDCSFTVVAITLIECFVMYTTDLQHIFCKFCIFWLTYVDLVFWDKFPFMFGNRGWINIRIGSFGSLLFFYPNKLFLESALELKLWK